MYGVQAHHLLLCDALGLDSSWDEVPSAQKNGRGFQTPWIWIKIYYEPLLTEKNGRILLVILKVPTIVPRICRYLRPRSTKNLAQ